MTIRCRSFQVIVTISDKRLGTKDPDKITRRMHTRAMKICELLMEHDALVEDCDINEVFGVFE